MSSRRTIPTIDFDAEARSLWARLNLDPDSRSTGQWNPLDPIFKHPTGGGVIYVGNQSAAENINLLKQHGVTRVVNCTHGDSKIPDFHAGKLNYYTFPVSHWQFNISNAHADVLAFVDPMFHFIEEAISKGESVLVHCLAGAHRAGTTGVSCLIHFADLQVDEAIRAAKKCRPIIDPIGQLPEFLKRLRAAEDYRERRGLPRFKFEVAE